MALIPLAQLLGGVARRAEPKLPPEQPFSLTTLTPKDEREFQAWLQASPWWKEFYAGVVRQEGLRPSPALEQQLLERVTRDPQYDYRGLWQARQEFESHGIPIFERNAADGLWHMPSKTPEGAWLKGPEHPSRHLQTLLEAAMAPEEDTGRSYRDEAIRAGAPATLEGLRGPLFSLPAGRGGRFEPTSMTDVVPFSQEVDLGATYSTGFPEDWPRPFERMTPRGQAITEELDRIADLLREQAPPLRHFLPPPEGVL